MFSKRIVTINDEASLPNRSPFKTPKKVLFQGHNKENESIRTSFRQEEYLFSPSTASYSPCYEKTPSKVKFGKKRSIATIQTPLSLSKNPSSLCLVSGEGDKDLGSPRRSSEDFSLSPFKKLSIHAPVPSNTLLAHWAHKKSRSDDIKKISKTTSKYSDFSSQALLQPSILSSPTKMNNKVNPLAKKPTLLDYFEPDHPRRDALGLTADSDEEGDIFSSDNCVLNSRNKSANSALGFRRSQSMCMNERDFVFGETTIDASTSIETCEPNKPFLLTPASSPINHTDDPDSCQETGEKCQLPYVETGKDALKRISPETLRELIQGKYKDLCDEQYVVDCRFPYEYEGGHIETAININTMEKLEEMFLQKMQGTTKRTIIVFHCEFSSHRAPRMALHLRKQDRLFNMKQYPKLTFPEIYILKGGYKEFWRTEAEYCQPKNYVEMNHNDHREALKLEMTRFKKSWKRCKSFSSTLDALNKELRETKRCISQPYPLALGEDSNDENASVSAPLKVTTSSFLDDDDVDGEPRREAIDHMFQT